MNDNGLLTRLGHVQKGLFEIGERSWALTIQDARGEIAKSVAEVARLTVLVEGKPIASAPKDGSRILVKLKNPLPVSGRDDLEHWHGIPFVARHPGVCEDGFDIGWGFAAPVGQGGFPDDWIECWWPLPFSSDDTTRRKDRE